MALVTVFAIFVIASLSNTFAEICSSNHSIGLSDGTFGEKGLIATSFLDIYHLPNWARLNQSRAWAPAFLGDVSRLTQQFVQIAFVDGQYLVTSVSLQGSPLQDWWVTKFRVATSNDGETFRSSTQIYDGNRDRSSVVVVLLANPTPSVYFRVVPTAWKNHIALRLELYGCNDFTY